MALAFRGAGTVQSGTTSVSLGYHASTAPGDLALMSLVIKPYNATIVVPGGWELLEEATNGSTGSGVDSGSTKVVLLASIASSASATETFEASGANVIEGCIVTYSKASNEAFAIITHTNGGDSTDGANYSATGAANINITTGDWLFGVAAVNTDGGTVSAQTVSATGATMGTVQSRVNSGTTTGDDARLIVVDRPVSSGTSSAAPVMTYTNATNSSGTSAFARIRVTTPTITATFNDSIDSPGFDIQLSGTTAADIFGVEYFNVEREDINGDYPIEHVRGMSEVEASVISASDYECPFVSQVQYNYKAYNTDGITYITINSSVVNPDYVRDVPGAAVELITGNFYVKDVLNPERSLAVAMMGIETFSVAGNILGEYHVLGRREPVVYTDVASSRKGTMTLLASVDSLGEVTIHSAKEHRTLLDTGEVLLFQSVKYPVDLKDMYFVVNSYSEKVLNRPNGEGLMIEFTIEFTEVDRPQTLEIAVSTATWNDVYTDPSFASWTDVNAAGSTWLEILQRYA